MGKNKQRGRTASEIFDNAYDLVKQKVKDIKDWSAIDVMMFAVIGMEVADTYPALGGAEKKDLVVRLAKKLVDEIDIGDQERSEWQLAIDVLLPGAIDQIVSAANGHVSVGQGGKPAHGTGCFACRRNRN